MTTLRLTLAFALVIFLAITSVVVVVRIDTSRQITSFMNRGGAFGMEELVRSLEEECDARGDITHIDIPLLIPRPPGRESTRRQEIKSTPVGGAKDGGPWTRITDQTGKILYDSHNGKPSGIITEEEKRRSISLKGKNDSITCGYLAVGNNDVGFENNYAQTLMQRLDSAAILSATFMSVLGVGLAFLLARTMIKPIKELTSAAQKLAAGDLSQRVNINGSDEVAILSASFNHMAESLQLSEQRRRAMTIDIAHELRTPIAVQRAQLEALQDGIYPLSQENVALILNQTELLARLVDDLRTLTLAEANELPLKNQLVDPEMLIDAVITRFRPLAESQEVSLVFESIAPDSSQPDRGKRKINVDPQRLEQVLNNIFSNALRYTPQGGKITISEQFSPSWIEIVIHDTGPGIPEESIPYVFDRFYRADRSRNRQDGGTTGLGLAISRQIARAQGGDLTVRNHTEGGAEFVLSLPSL